MITKRLIKNIHIYILKDPETHEIKYVGKTNDLKTRLNFHCKPAARDHSAKTQWVQSLLDKGLQPIIESIERVHKDNWEEREIFWIKHYKDLGANLLNSVSGGKGSYNPIEEVRAKRTLYLTKRWQSP